MLDFGDDGNEQRKRVSSVGFSVGCCSHRAVSVEYLSAKTLKCLYHVLCSLPFPKHDRYIAYAAVAGLVRGSDNGGRKTFENIFLKYSF